MSLELGDLLDYATQTPMSDSATTALAAAGYSNPYTAIGELAFQIIQQVFGIPDPLDLLLSLFAGRPTMEATIDEAKVLKSYSSPPLALMAIGAADLVNRNIPLSSPAAGPIYGEYFAAGVMLEQAIRWSNFTPNLAQIEASTLEQAQYEAANPNIAPPTTLNAVEQVWNQNQNDPTVYGAMQTLAQTSAQDPASQLAKGAAQQYLLSHQPPASPPGGTTGGNQTGTTTGSTTGTTTTIPPPGPPQPTDPTDSDELNDRLYETNSYLYYIINAANQNPPSENSQCCEQVIAVINLLETSLQQIKYILASPADAPQLAAINQTLTVALHNIREGIDAIPAATTALGPELCNCIGAPLKSIADTLNAMATAASPPSADNSGIVEQLKVIAGQGDVDQFIFDALNKLGLVSPDDLQTLQGLKWSDALSYITHTTIYRTVSKWAGDMGADVQGAAAWVKGELGAGANWAEQMMARFLTPSGKTLLEQLVEKSLAIMTSTLKPTGPVAINSINVDPDKSLTVIVGLYLEGLILSTLVSLVREGAGEQLTKSLEVLTGILGIEEIREVQIGPLVREGIGKIAEQNAKATFRQHIPGAEWAYHHAARGIISRTVADYLATLDGLPKELEVAAATGAESGLQARLMVRLIETGLFTEDEIRDELTFRGMRRISQDRMLRAAAYQATNTERNRYKAELEKAYAAGLLDDSDLVNQYDGADQILDRGALLLGTNHLSIQIDTAKALETEYSTLFAAGLIDQITYEADLAGIPLQPWKANNLAAVQELKASARLARQEAAAARALAKATTAEERKVAIANYVAGNINAPALAAALVLTGLTPVQAAAFTDMAALRKAGSARWIYNLKLTPEAATILKARVSALTDQFKRMLISQDQYTQGLQALGLDDTHVNAVLAAAAALVTPKKSAYVVPVQTA